MISMTRARLIGGIALAVLLACGYATVLAQAPHVPQQTCGNEGQVPCSMTLFNAVCDTGLEQSAPYTCGCLLQGPFGGCLLPQLCTKCINFTRQRTPVNAFTNSWTDWALRNQRQ